MAMQKAATVWGNGGWLRAAGAMRRRQPPAGPKSGLLGRLKSISPYALVLAVLAVALALAASPFSGSLVQRWSEADVRARSYLIHRTIGPLVERAAAAGDW